MQKYEQRRKTSAQFISAGSERSCTGAYCTTYKLKLNHGDLKATQGDTGHAEIEMITKVYAHILDEDRKINAQKFDSAFYSNPDLRQVKAPQAQGISAEQLLSQLKESPELASALAQLLAGGKAG